jgi:hypothetical protein
VSTTFVVKIASNAFVSWAERWLGVVGPDVTSVGWESAVGLAGFGEELCIAGVSSRARKAAASEGACGFAGTARWETLGATALTATAVPAESGVVTPREEPAEFPFVSGARAGSATGDSTTGGKATAAVMRGARRISFGKAVEFCAGGVAEASCGLLIRFAGLTGTAEVLAVVGGRTPDGAGGRVSCWLAFGFLAGD